MENTYKWTNLHTQKYEDEETENCDENNEMLSSQETTVNHSQIKNGRNGEINDSDKDIEANETEETTISTLMDAVNEMSENNHIRPQITFLDFAGQRMYYAFHQIYLSPKTIYILVVDMTKDLEDEVEVDDDEKGCSGFDSWVYKGKNKSLFYNAFLYSSVRP